MAAKSRGLSSLPQTLYKVAALPFFVNETHLSSSLSARLKRLLIGGAYGRESRPDLNFRQISIDVLSGLTVSLALVPEAVAFAFVAGVAPLVGLYAAFIVGLITAVFAS